MIIRDAKPDDLAAIEAVTHAAYHEFATRLEPGGWERMTQSLAAPALIAAGVTMLVAEHDGQVRASVGYCPAGRCNPEIYPDDWACVRALAVHPAARSLGLGRALTQACIDRARRDNCAIIGLHTSEAMDGARALYGRMGFVVVSELPPLFGLRYWLFRKDLV
jgi:ribosomal protein S18 acetylase RimI-like enzyme